MDWIVLVRFGLLFVQFAGLGIQIHFTIKARKYWKAGISYCEKWRVRLAEIEDIAKEGQEHGSES